MNALVSPPVSGSSSPDDGLIRARVVRIRPREDGVTYAVTLGTNSSTVYWLLTDQVLRVGDRVEVRAASLQRRKLSGRSSEVSIIRGGELAVVSDEFTRRLVAPAWYERVRAAMRRPLFPYQTEGAAWLSSRLYAGQGAILADEMGLGKTCQAIAALITVGCMPALIVCPSSLKGNWRRELGYAQQKRIIHLVEHEKGPLPKAHFVVTNYDLLRAREQQLITYGFKSIALDEGQAVKEPTPGADHRASVVTRICSHISNVLLLTGTPMLNRPAELWRMLHLVAPDQWPDFEQFRARYCQRGEDGLIDGLVTGHGMVERVTELRCLIDELMLRRSKADLLHKLPPKVRRSVVCDLEPQDRAHYDAASKNVVKWLRSIGSEMARTAVGNEALVRFTMLRHIAARGKLRKAVGVFLRQWFSEKRRPLVVFGFHRDVIAGVRAICARIGVRTACILGEYSGERRQAELDSFQCGNADVFVAPLRAAGVGLNLQRASDALVLERLWTPSLGEQAEDRLHRLGQTRQVTIWYLDARDTIDQHIAEIQRDKHKLIGRVVDDVSAEQQRAEEQQTIEQLAQLLSTKG